MEKKQCEVNINFRVSKEKIQHIYNARDELAKAGITFDTGGCADGDFIKYDWEFDWSLKGGVVVNMECLDCKKKDEVISKLRFRLNRPYEAFLLDAANKDNCRNCTNYRGQCSPPNSDRVNCNLAEGWPHWTTKCRHWEKKAGDNVSELSKHFQPSLLL